MERDVAQGLKTASQKNSVRMSARATKKKTILLLTACYDEPNRTMGSVPKMARQLSQYARVVVFSGGSSTRVENRSKNLRVYFFKEWLIPDPVNNGFIPGMWKQLRTVLAKEKPDAVLNVKYMFYPNLLGPYLRRKGYRVVTATDTFPGYDWFSASPLVNAVLWLYTRTLGLWVLRSSSKVVLFHDALVPTAKRLQLPYSVIPNGVEFELIDKARAKKLSGALNVLYVGRLESVKGYQTICEAMRTVTETYAATKTTVHFYHVGDKTGKDSFVAQYKNKYIHFEGRKSIEEVYSYMLGADIIVLASKSEGLPNTIMEGMACGCVPVSTPVGAVPRLLEGGRLGRLFSYGDEQGLAKQVAWLIEHPKERARMATLGTMKIRKEHNWNTLAKQYMDELFVQ